MAADPEAVANALARSYHWTIAPCGNLSLIHISVKAGANTAIGYAHKKIYEAEDENVGIKAAHRSELVGEARLRTAYHRHKTAPYRKAAKLQQKSAKANARLAYRQALSDRPELKKHAIARIWQKQKLKRQYAKAAREAGKQAKNAAVATERVSVGRCV